MTLQETPFKTQKLTNEDYVEFLSKSSKSRKYSAIRALQKYLSAPGIVNLGGGLPNPNSFPFKDISITTQDGTLLRVDPKDLQSALQYGQTKGDKDFVAWIKDLQTAVHKPPSPDFDVCIGCGSQDLMVKAFEMFLNPGDTILIENPTYVGMLAFLKPFGVKFARIGIDALGLSATELRSVLTNWDVSLQGPIPKVLYTVGSGGNPTGITTTTHRKQEIYQIASEFNIIILEDDPYYYLQYNTQNREKSYFGMDVDGRVLRFDSFSKVLAAGARLGFVTGPPFLIDRLQMHQMSTTLSPSGLSQLILYQYLNHQGLDGFLEHVSGPNCTLEYKKRRDLFVSYLEKYLTGKATWNVPSAGMFCWIDLSPSGISDTFTLISEEAIAKGVLLVPGREFYAWNEGEEVPCSFVRASFSYSTPQDMEEGVKRLASIL